VLESKLNLNTCIGKAWGLIDDETGATFWPTNAGACFNAGNARFRVAGVDLAALYASAGNDYMLWLFDHLWRVAAKGYIDVADDAEATGGDLFDAGAGIFTAGTYSWVAYGTNTIANDANTLKITWGDNTNGAYLILKDATDLSSDLTVGKLYKLTFDAKVDAGVVTFVVQTNTGTGPNVSVTETDFTGKTIYFVATTVTEEKIRMSGMDTDNDIIWLDNLVLEEVTNVGADGVLIMSTKGGTTQSWADLETGIDLNDITYFEVLIAK